MTTIVPSARPTSRSDETSERAGSISVAPVARVDGLLSEGTSAETVAAATSATPVAAPRERRQVSAGSARREEILDGASEMFAEHGYDGASVRHIATYVGISHPGMLHHFPSKVALLDAVIDRLEAHAQAALDHVDDISADPGALFRALAELWNPASHPIQLLASLDANSVSRNHPGRFRMARLRRVHEHVLEQCFIALGERGLLRDGIEPAFASRALLALVLSHAVRENTVRALQNGDHDDYPLKALGTLTRLFLHHPAAPGQAH